MKTQFTAGQASRLFHSSNQPPVREARVAPGNRNGETENWGTGETVRLQFRRLGGFGPNNQLIVSNGASVVAAVDGFLGHDPGASNNVALVTGAGSMWTIGDGLLIGYQEGRNLLVVSNGAVVADRIGHLGYFSIADNNVAVVTGAGSVWITSF